jgi:tRNA dimethylallyltransferase
MPAAPLIVVAGPTGSGKTELAIRLAESVGGEIVNFDSVQIYRGFDIGSAKATPAQQARVKHHLLDVIEATEEMNAAGYARLAGDVLTGIEARGKRAILVGGTFFYLRAILSGLPEMPDPDEGIRARIRRISAVPRGAARLHRWLTRVDPVSAQRIAPADRHRVERALEVLLTSGRPISSWERPTEERPAVKLALQIARPALVPILDARVDAMFRDGLVEETRALLGRYPPTARPFTTIGYREAAAVVAGAMDEAAARAETRRRTRAYAKRQLTWLRSERNVQWLDASDREAALAAAMRLIKEQS